MTEGPHVLVVDDELQIRRFLRISLEANGYVVDEAKSGQDAILKSARLRPEMVDDAPKAKQYYSDAFDVYAGLWYNFGKDEVSEGKTDTYSVEADNAELRHYLARLARQCSHPRRVHCLHPHR